MKARRSRDVAERIVELDRDRRQRQRSKWNKLCVHHKYSGFNSPEICQVVPFIAPFCSWRPQSLRRSTLQRERSTGRSTRTYSAWRPQNDTPGSRSAAVLHRGPNAWLVPNRAVRVNWVTSVRGEITTREIMQDQTNHNRNAESCADVKRQSKILLLRRHRRIAASAISSRPSLEPKRRY